MICHVCSKYRHKMGLPRMQGTWRSFSSYQMLLQLNTISASCNNLSTNILSYYVIFSMLPWVWIYTSIWYKLLFSVVTAWVLRFCCLVGSLFLSSRVIGFYTNIFFSLKEILLSLGTYWRYPIGSCNPSFDGEAMPADYSSQGQRNWCKATGLWRWCRLSGLWRCCRLFNYSPIRT
jgi:hypothetical protein